MTDISQKGDKELAMQVLFHLSDISNTSKVWAVTEKWIDLLFEEFFKQGDQERDLGQPITYLMDRETINIAKSQGGFIDFIIAPSWEVLTSMLPKLAPLNDMIKRNKETWASKVDVYERRLEAEKAKLA